MAQDSRQCKWLAGDGSPLHPDGGEVITKREGVVAIRGLNKRKRHELMNQERDDASSRAEPGVLAYVTKFVIQSTPAVGGETRRIYAGHIWSNTWVSF